MDVEDKNCSEDRIQLQLLQQQPNSIDMKENVYKHNSKLYNNSNTAQIKSSLLGLGGSSSGSVDLVGGGSVGVVVSDKDNNVDSVEDCEMRVLDNDYEPESSALTTPLSSDLEQTPRSSSEVEGGDGDGDKSVKNEPAIHIQHYSATTITPTPNNNGHSTHSSTPNLTKRSVTLQMLMAAGILKPGDGTMSLEYHGQKFMGDLLENGQIRSQETSQEFSSPSAWATACKQIINPEKNSRKSGCGWASIKHRNLKLDYYKTVWFKRLREGSIDLKHISNGASSSSSDTEEEDAQFCVVKFGEHFDSSPGHAHAQQMGAKVLISCTEFKTIDRLQPFHVKISDEALALADVHCNMLNTECIGYISGHWNGDQNCLKMETVHPSRILMPHSSSLACDLERNRIALDIQRLGQQVVGWYHSHPKAPPHPTKDDVGRQLDYQVMMKGASESSYIPCVGIIISPLCYTSQEGCKKSQMQLFWVLPPPENRPLEMGRPMRIEYETYSESKFNRVKMLSNMASLLNFYKENKTQVDINDLTVGKFEKLKDSLCSLKTELKGAGDFWKQVRELILAPLTVSVPSPKLASSFCEEPTPISIPIIPMVSVMSSSAELELATSTPSIAGSTSDPSSPDVARNSSTPTPTPSASQVVECRSSTTTSTSSSVEDTKFEPPESDPMEMT